MQHLLWLDVEQCDAEDLDAPLLEVGAVVTDHQCRPIDCASRVYHYGGPIFSFPEVVQKIHERSGLWDECRQSPWSADSHWAWLDTLVERYWPRPQQAVLAGFNVGSFDHAILKRRAPAELLVRFSHRHFDLSTLRVMLNENTTVWKADPGPHRALFDCFEAIRWYHRWRTVVGLPEVRLGPV